MDTKKKLDKLKLYSESYDAAIKRLIYRRNFDVVNNSVVDLEPDEGFIAEATEEMEHPIINPTTPQKES